MKKTAPWIAVAVAGFLSACGGSSGGGSSQSSAVTPATSTTTPAATPTPSTPTTPTTPLTPVIPGSFAAAAAALYTTAPDLDACRAGTLTAAAKADALASINTIRALHGLAPVVYSDADDAQEAESSLIMAANLSLSHTPPTTWKCYSATGSTGAGSSNLYIGWGSGLSFASADDHFAAWLNEGGSASLGHRRWILSPFLGKIAYGRLTTQTTGGTRVDASSMKVFGFTGGTPSPATVPAFVALPQGDYPVRYFRASDYLSFSIAPSGANDSAAGRVDFSAARVSVSAGSTTLPVTDLASDNDGYGLANNLQWRVTGLQAGVAYTVSITGITRAPQTSYSYTFRIVS